MLELARMLADNGLSLEAEYADGDLVFVLRMGDLYCAFKLREEEKDCVILADYFEPAIHTFRRIRQEEAENATKNMP